MREARRPALVLRVTALPVWTPRRLIVEALDLANRMAVVVEVMAESGRDLWSVAPGDCLPDEVKAFTANLNERCDRMVDGTGRCGDDDCAVHGAARENG